MVVETKIAGDGTGTKGDIVADYAVADVVGVGPDFSAEIAAGNFGAESDDRVIANMTLAYEGVVGDDGVFADVGGTLYDGAIHYFDIFFNDDMSVDGSTG